MITTPGNIPLAKLCTPCYQFICTPNCQKLCIVDYRLHWRGKPKVIRVDNGPEYTSKDFEWWCRERHIIIQFIQPGRPMQNGFIERFNGSYRKEILDAYVFFELNEVRALTVQWIEEYNTRRPHEGLGNATPREWLEKLKSTN